MCEVLDFQIFTAAMVLILSILSHRQNSATISSLPLPIFDEIPDWTLVDTSVQCLLLTSDKLDCSVAKQGADTLQAFIRIYGPHRSPYPPMTSQENLVVTIRYFGRFKIIYRSHVAHVSNGSSLPPSQCPSVEFSRYSKQNFPSSSFSDMSFGEELGVDWYQQSNDTPDSAYDLTKLFNC